MDLSVYLFLLLSVSAAFRLFRCFLSGFISHIASYALLQLTIVHTNEERKSL